VDPQASDHVGQAKHLHEDRENGGRPQFLTTVEGSLATAEQLVEPTSAGGPEPLRCWAMPESALVGLARLADSQTAG